MTPTIRIIGVPMDLGQQHRGVDMGPVAIRYAGLGSSLTSLGYRVEDMGNIQIPGHYTLKNSAFLKRLPLISRGCEETYRLGREAIKAGALPVFLGGDHSAAIGSIGGVTHSKECGVIWIDAHADFNTPEISSTGNIHGMTLAILLGSGPDALVDVGRPGAKLTPAKVVMIGLRDIDPEEKQRVRASGCTVFTMRDIDEIGIHAVLKKGLAALHHLDRIHVSLDLDSIRPADAPGVGTPVRGGLTYREAQLVMEMICDTGKLQSLDLMEVNPILDERNKTAEVAVALAASLFGKSII